MKRVQFYPKASLDAALEYEAQISGIGVSTIVVDILSAHYGLIPKNKLSQTQVTAKVFAEIHSYIANPSLPRYFDINSASPTYRSISMVSDSKPSTARAKIGQAFSAEVRRKNSQFPNVRPYLKNGKIQRSENNAAIYEIY